MCSDCIESGELFECRMCGDCCLGYGGTYLSEADIEAISRFIGSDPERFVARYCRLSGTKRVLAQRSDGYCIFWDKTCTIHAVKPNMCRAWPFIESVLVDTINWRSMASMCPGIRTDASDQDICRCVRDKLSTTKCDRR